MGHGIGLVDPRTCLTCFLESRRRLGLDEPSLRKLVLDHASSRTRLFVESYAAAGDPYRARRRELNEAGLRLLAGLGLNGSTLPELLALSALSNSVDAWMPWLGETGVALEGSVEGDPAAAAELVAGADTVAYLLDNAGEAVIDLAVACVLAEQGVRVTVIARSEPYEVDVTVDDARGLARTVSGLLGCPEPRIVGTGSRYPAPATPYVSREAVEALRRADVVVSKGIANLEALMEFESVERWRTVVALRAKCPVVARLLGVGVGDAYVGVGYP